MAVSVEQNDGIDTDLVGPESKSLPPSPPPLMDDNDNKANEDEPEKDLDALEEGEKDSKKKKSKSGKKSKKGKSPKTGRKQLADDVNTILENGGKTAPSKSKKRSSIGNTSSKSSGKSRRQSTSSAEKNPNSEGTTENPRASDSNHSSTKAVPQSDEIGDDSVKNSSIASRSNSNKPSSIRSFDSVSSQKSQSRPVSIRSFDNSVQSSQNMPASTRSFDNSVQSSQNMPASTRSFDNSVQSSQNMPASTRSFDSNQTPKSLGRHFGGDGNSKKKNQDGMDEFASDVEDETMCSIDNINLVVNDNTRVLDDEKSEGEIQLSDEKKTKVDTDQKPKKKKQPQLAQTDEIGRGSSHYKLEGVYYNQKKESTRKKSEMVEELEVSTIPLDGRSKTPIKGRIRSRRRRSLGDDGIASPRSRSRELTKPRSRSRELTSPRSRSRELTSPRNKTPRDFTRSQDILGRSSHKKRSDKQVKRGSTAGIISKESKEAVSKIFGMDGVMSDDNTTVVKNTTLDSQPSSTADEKTTPAIEIEQNSTENQEPSNSPSKEEQETADDNEETKPPSKSEEKKQRRRNSMGKSMRKDRAATQINAEKELAELGVVLPDDDLVVTITTENETSPEAEIVESSSSHPSVPEYTEAENENGLPATSNLNYSEMNPDNAEKLNKKNDTSSENVEKKQRRRNSMGKVSKKDKSNKSSVKIPKKSMRDKKSTPKDLPSSDADAHADTTELSSPSVVPNGVSDIEKEINEAMKEEAKDSAKNQSSSSKTTKKNKTSRRRSVKARKKRESVSKETILEINTSVTDDPVMKLNSDKAAEKSLPSSSTRSLRDFISSHHSKREKNSQCSDADSFFSESLASDESEEKDSESVVDDNYLQLTFSTEHGTDGNALFAMMDEKFQQSFQSLGLQREMSERNVSHKSFFSFADEIDLKVSTTSYSLSKNEHVAKNKDDYSTDDDFLEDDDGLAHETLEYTPAIKRNKFLTPVPKKKKLPSFGISQSLHNPGLRKSQSFANGTSDLTPRKGRRGMLQTLKMGSQRTLQKAASSRNMLGQATTRMLARNTEEGKGLLKNASWGTDSDSD